MTKQEIWSPRVAAWRASGKSLAAFCTNESFTPNALRYWVGRLPETAATPRPRRAKPLSVEGARDGAASRSVALARVVVAPTPRALTVEVGAARILVPAGFDPELLRGVVQTLTMGAR